MTRLSGELGSLAVLFIFCFFLSILFLFLSFILSTPKPDVEKLSAYECGFEPYEDARNLFDVRFYLIGMMFIVFDLEAIYFFPWCVSFAYVSNNGVFIMVDFIVELLVGLLYAYRVGALNWK